MDFDTTSNTAQNPGPASSMGSSNIELFESGRQPAFGSEHPTSNTDHDILNGDLLWPSDSQEVQIADLQKE